MAQHHRVCYFRFTESEVWIWDVQRLWYLAASLPIQHLPLTQFGDIFGQSVWLGEGPPRNRSIAPLPTLRAVAQYARASYQTDLAYPIIVSAEGDVMDGRHRLVKAWMLDDPTIAVVRFEQTPQPDDRQQKRQP